LLFNISPRYMQYALVSTALAFQNH
jgi:hypothetical protein